MRRACLVSLMLTALIAPPSALGQGSGNSPFSPQLPSAPQAPAEPPEPQPADRNTNDDGLGGTAFWLIIGTTGALFVAVAFFITRDMRRTAGTKREAKRRLRGTGRPAAAAADALAEPAHRTGSQRAKAKAQQRAKTKAARKQRRKSR
jgi:predicted lipid-binding transport protein (Tim44 family)